jgi:60 kDa SS-A/Ro ribonucleoprotein
MDNFRMVRNFVQIIRSGVLGRKSFGSFYRGVIQDWLNKRTGPQLFRDSVGKSPSMSDVIKMVHPKPPSKDREALYGYLLGKSKVNSSLLPNVVKQYEAWKRDEKEGGVPKVPFQMLTGLPLNDVDWKVIARDAKWQMTRMNIATFKRHNVFDHSEMVQLITSRLRDRESVIQAKQFPYQILQSYYASMECDAPKSIQNALQDALDYSLDNIPQIRKHVVICPDVSGSMQDPITGRHRGHASAVTCKVVAGLIAAAFMKKSDEYTLLPFSDKLYKAEINNRDSLATITKFISSFPAGGTTCSLPMIYLNEQKITPDLVIYVSDSESWLDEKGHSRNWYDPSGPTRLITEWKKLKKRNPKAKMVCIDLTPTSNTQAYSDKDILNVGGFSDTVFNVVSDFVNSGSDDHWVNRIKEIEV